jgi:HAD superfamily hydrolase (TIGR01459 family)
MPDASCWRLRSSAEPLVVASHAPPRVAQHAATVMIPPIIASAGPLLERYEAVFCDVWGVLHDGRHAHPQAGEALARFRAGGGTVILVSNAPIPQDGVAEVLAKTGVRRDAWDSIVSSGDIALSHIAEKGYRRLHQVGPSRRDYRLYVRLPVPQQVAIDEAEAIICTGLCDDRNETIEHYRGLIAAGIARGLPFVCANPDLVVDVGGSRLPCAGSIAAEYERQGGEVFWAGKPHPSAYATALQRAGTLRGQAPCLQRILGIGDAVRTDLASARGLGIDGLLIAGGIHDRELLRDGEIDRQGLAAMFAAPETPPAVGAMVGLRW